MSYKSKLLNSLKNRDLIHSISDEAGLDETLKKEPLSFNCGFDPTAKSLHIGSLLPILNMKRLADAGNKPIVLIGTATGMIGDPSGKSDERTLLDTEEVLTNATSIEKQITSILGTDSSVVHNHKWLEKLSMIEFLREVGKHFSVNAMCSKDSVKDRLENREQGISYTEFSYMLLQAYDFYHLNSEHNCRMQIGGSDQWGNITEGLELIRRLKGEQKDKCFGLTFPLLTTSSGGKFGKTEKGAVWLDPDMSSPYEFYQYWINSADEDAEKLLFYFTDLEVDEVKDLIKDSKKSPEKRIAQTRLAEELTTLVHGEEEVKKSKAASKVFFGGSLKDVSVESLKSIFSDVPSTSLKSEDLKDGLGIIELLVKSTLAKSKGEARRLIEGGGIYVNNERVEASTASINTGDFIEQSVLVIRSGKKKYHLIEIN